MQDLVILEDDFPIFNPIARTIKQYNQIIVRDKGSKGDNQGRKKIMATKELAFVWFFSCLTSSYNINTEDEVEREKLIKRDIELPEGWKRDDVINNAIAYFCDYQETPTSGLLQTVRRTLNKSKKMFSILEGKLDLMLESLVTQTEVSDEQARINEEKIVSLVSRIMEMSMKLTTQLETLDTLEQKYVKELEVKKGKGQKAINSWEL